MLRIKTTDKMDSGLLFSTLDTLDMPSDSNPDHEKMMNDPAWCAMTILARALDSLRTHTKPLIRDRIELNPESKKIETYSTIDENSGLAWTLWLRFTWEVCLEVLYVRCEACDNIFPLGEGSSRSDRIYCGATCRTRVYRHRIRDARKLRAEGATIPQIAKKLDADPKAVKGWVADVKKAPRK